MLTPIDWLSDLLKYPIDFIFDLFPPSEGAGWKRRIGHYLVLLVLVVGAVVVVYFLTR